MANRSIYLLVDYDNDRLIIILCNSNNIGNKKQVTLFSEFPMAEGSNQFCYGRQKQV